MNQAIVCWNGLAVSVGYTFTKGQREEGPSYASGGQPAEPPEIEILSAAIRGDDDQEVGNLSDRHYDALLESAWGELCEGAVS
jgi:hypothetical protein